MSEVSKYRKEKLARQQKWKGLLVECEMPSLYQIYDNYCSYRNWVHAYQSENKSINQTKQTQTNKLNEEEPHHLYTLSYILLRLWINYSKDF